MNRLLTIGLLAAGILTVRPSLRAQPAKPAGYVIIGYLTGSGWTKEQVEAQKMTHINYAFAEPAANGELAPLTAKDSANLAALTSLRSVNKDLKILISIGGWGGCKYFSNVALDEAARSLFTKSCLAVLRKHKLDGIDIDWEYPAQPGAGNIYRPEDKQNYTLLFKALRAGLDEQGQRDRRTGANHYLLTTATGVDTAFVNHTELGKAQQYLDFVNIMTYDIYHGNDKVTGHHSNLYQSKSGNQSRNSMADGVEGHIRAGVPVSKIVLGLPFYGRGWHDVADKNRGLYQPSTGKHDFIGYDVLVDQYINKNGFTRYWDDDAKSPYLWNPTSHTFISYADPETFASRIDFVKRRGLAGVMFWEYVYELQQKKLLNTLVNGLPLRRQQP
ncbi:glycoside hydrolase family 18 protein [Spirosoma luteolum]